MDLTIPRKDLPEMVLYTWKIIRLPSIFQEDLLYKLSFELFLYDTNAAKNFINLAVEQGLILKTSHDELSLSEDLKEKLNHWQLLRKKEISEKLKSIQILKKIESIPKEESTDFTILFKSFVDAATLSRIAPILHSDIHFVTKNLDKGIIKVKVKGSKDVPYSIEVNTEDKYIHHDCHDYETRKSQSKKFCKHLAKVFLMLKDEDEKKATILLNKIANQINEWNFD